LLSVVSAEVFRRKVVVGLVSDFCSKNQTLGLQQPDFCSERFGLRGVPRRNDVGYRYIIKMGGEGDNLEREALSAFDLSPGSDATFTSLLKIYQQSFGPSRETLAWRVAASALAGFSQRGAAMSAEACAAAIEFARTSAPRQSRVANAARALLLALVDAARSEPLQEGERRFAAGAGALALRYASHFAPEGCIAGTQLAAAAFCAAAAGDAAAALEAERLGAHAFLLRPPLECPACGAPLTESTVSVMGTFYCARCAPTASGECGGAAERQES
jgi:hypothetical protein